MEEKSISEVFQELRKSNQAFKFSYCNGLARVSIDGFHSSLIRK